MIKGYIVDVDGTLYSQKKMHFYMVRYMGFSVIKNPTLIRELIVVKQFREYRENNRQNNFTVNQICEIISNNSDFGFIRINEIIRRWMFIIPLRYLEKCKRKKLISWLNEEVKNGKKVYIYSDYEAKEKCDILGIKYSDLFVSDEIGYLKPDKRAMRIILDSIKEKSNELVYIGDRDEIDGEAARNVRIRYIDVRRFRKDLL